MSKPLYEGSITDVHGIRVGQAENRAAMTGVTVVLCSRDGATIGADVRGAAPGTREIALTWSENTVERANAVMLAGGSAFGLDAAGGVMRFLEEADVGVDTGVGKVPIVPAAVLFDLAVGDAKVRPDASMGYEACRNASKDVEQGAFGAGTGATVGKLVPGTLPMPGGTGTASMMLACGVTVGAIACVNAVGDVF
ncbi:MAG TPA: P1 family peptidase, partial [Candidatus Limiplasma sp.]|nr:P1 family peptidase [Candidatus Limiplasma sp.]